MKEVILKTDKFLGLEMVSEPTCALQLFGICHGPELLYCNNFYCVGMTMNVAKMTPNN